MSATQSDAIESHLAALGFDNRFAAELPADPEPSNFRRQVAKACYSRVEPTPVTRPKLIGWSPEAAALLDLPADPGDGNALAEIFAGNRLLAGMLPIATCYGGHQFGHWAGQLGDGPGHQSGRGRQPAWRALDAAAQGGRPDALFANRRWSCSAAVVAPRVSLQRGHVPPWRADHAGAIAGPER